MEGRDDAKNAAIALHEAACRHDVEGRADAKNAAIALHEAVCLRMAINSWREKSTGEREGMPASIRNRIADAGRGTRAIAPTRRSFARGGCSGCSKRRRRER